MTTTRAIATLLVCACLVAGVAASLEDGLPRPLHFRDEPTTAYGSDPVLTDSGTPADCAWYGFSNTLFTDDITTSCQTTLRKALLNATANPPSELNPYVYYTLMRLIHLTTNESYCYQGCFKLDLATPPVTSPPPYALRGPAPAPSYAMPPVISDPGPAMAPVAEAPYEAPYGVPAMSPGN